MAVPFVGSAVVSLWNHFTEQGTFFDSPNSTNLPLSIGFCGYVFKLGMESKIAAENAKKVDGIIYLINQHNTTLIAPATDNAPQN